MKLDKKKTFIFLLLILIIAGFFRFYRIQSVPPGVHYDEKENVKDALETLENNQFKVFYPGNFGREGLYIWLIAFSFKFFGFSSVSLRLVGAIIGILTVLGLFLLTQQLFDKKIALLSSFFLSVSFWHVNFSRIGYRAILVPFILCYSFYFLIRAIKTKKIINFILAGIFFGLGFYTYIAFRAAILLLGIVIIIEMYKYYRRNKPFKFDWKKIYLRDGWWKWDLFLIITLIVILPLGIYFFNNPSQLSSRSSNISVFSAEQPFRELGISAVKTLGMFNVYGDANWRHNLAKSPLLVWPVGILFIIGLILAIKNLIKKESLDISLFLISWFAIMLLPALLTFEGMPHALRSIGVIPVVYILAALGLSWLIKLIPNRKLAAIVLILFLLCPVLVNYQKYFVEWANSPNVEQAFK